MIRIFTTVNGQFATPHDAQQYMLAEQEWREAEIRRRKRRREEEAQAAAVLASLKRQEEERRKQWEAARQAEAARRRELDLAYEKRRAVAENANAEYGALRNEAIWVARARGEPVKAVAEEFGLTMARIHQIYESEQGKRLLRLARRNRVVSSRPIDMGGPRDVWLTWTPEQQFHEFRQEGAAA